MAQVVAASLALQFLFVAVNVLVLNPGDDKDLNKPLRAPGLEEAEEPLCMWSIEVVL